MFFLCYHARMDTSLFDYPLPPDRIAQHSLSPRDAAKLLVLNRNTGKTKDNHVFDLPSLLHKNDLLIFNDSKVFKSRLAVQKTSSPSSPAIVSLELFLLRPEEEPLWLALLRPAKKIHVGESLQLPDDSLACVVKKNADGTALIDMQRSADAVFTLADQYGEVPVPPYVEPSKENTESYQTVYAKERGSVAAPTAGFHFTKPLLQTLATQGVRTAFVTLHVGIGTFRPMKSAQLEEHRMHEEWGRVYEETVQLIRKTKEAGGRVLVVGTTTMRALESWAACDMPLKGWSGFTELFITPGYPFHVADGLITNFHLPKSTLLVMISAFASREQILTAYAHAIKQDYRFYSFGDAMLIL